MTDEVNKKRQVRVQCLTGVNYDLVIETPVAVFARLVAGDGFLVMNDTTVLVPFHAIGEFREIISPAQQFIATAPPVGAA